MKWKELEEREKNHEKEIGEELARQEKLLSLEKLYQSEKEDLEQWCEEKKGYLSTKEEIDSLGTSLMKLMHLSGLILFDLM